MREAMIVGYGRVEVIDLALRNALGIKVVGASTGGGQMRAHLSENSAVADEKKAVGVLERYGALTIESDKASIVANGTDTATIRYAGIGTVDWIAYLDGEVYATGEEMATASMITASMITLTLATEIRGQYEIHVISRGANAASGMVQVEAV